MQDEEVIRLFNDSSEDSPSVKAVRIIRDPATNIGKGFGYVLFADKNAARMALAKEGLMIRKRPLRITRVTKSKPKVAESTVARYTGALGAEGRFLLTLTLFRSQVFLWNIYSLLRRCFI